MADKNEFEIKREYGERGEVFFDRYVGSLLRSPVFIRGRKVKRIEGGDCFYVQEGTFESRKGFAEVKTYGNLSILKFGAKNDLTIPFELSSYEAGTDQTKKEWRPGWGLQLLHWAKYNDYAEKRGLQTRAVCPKTLAYLFCESDRYDVVQPFVCIAFEVFEKTRKKIVKAANDYLGIDIEDWEKIIREEGALWKGKPGVHDNEWNIPFSELYDGKTTTVTMIDSLPSDVSIEYFGEKERKAYSEDNLKMFVNWRRSRLDKLITASGGRKLDSSEEEKILRKIEEKAGCKVHRIPFIPQRITAEDSVLELLNEWIEKYDEQKKEEAEKEFIERFGVYPWLYFF